MSAPVHAEMTADASLGDASEMFLARSDLDGDTIRSYGQTMRRLCRELGGDTPLDRMTAERVAEVFAVAWGDAAARTWNRHRAALGSFATWAAGCGRDVGDLTACIERRPVPRGPTRVIGRHAIVVLLEYSDVSLRERTLWRLLYESAVGVGSVLSLDVDDLDLPNDRARTGEDGSDDRVCWQAGTGRLLAELVDGRERGPVFLADRRPAPARMPAASDLCPVTGRGRLSYERAEYLFKQATKRIDPAGRGYTLHRLRHARFAHLREDGWMPPPPADGSV